MDGLPGRLAGALRRWGCEVDGAELRGGMSVVVPVRAAGGAALMVKVLEPAFAAREATALRAFPAAASVCCFDHDEELGALLLERLTARSLAGADPEELITVQAGLARRLAVPDPGGIDRLADTAGWLDHLDGLLRPRPRLLTDRAVDQARDAISDLADDPTDTLTHGDLHAINVHRDGDGRWRALDPNPRIGTIAYESHTVIVERDRLPALIRAGAGELRRRLARFAEVSGADRGLAERLCQARAVSSALAEHPRRPDLGDQLRWMAEALTDPG